MGRPKIPLISKREVLQVALMTIDDEGLAALSIRRLAEQLNVNGASLYHHFRNKDEILVGAAKLALEEVRVPLGHEEPWRVWMLRNTTRLRAAFVAHPDLAPIMLGRDALGIGTSRLDATVTLLEAQGVPIGAIAPMLEALEIYAIGDALHEINDGSGNVPRHVPHGPHFSRAIAQRAASTDDLFDMVCAQIMDVALRAARCADELGNLPGPSTSVQSKTPRSRTATPHSPKRRARRSPPISPVGE